MPAPASTPSDATTRGDTSPRRQRHAHSRQQQDEGGARCHPRLGIGGVRLPEEVVDPEGHAERWLQQREQRADDDADTKHARHRRATERQHEDGGTYGGDPERLVEGDVGAVLHEDGGPGSRRR
jgi:hypothetical protein